MIAEESTAWPMVSRPTDMGGLGFGLKWNMGWMHDTLDYMQQGPDLSPLPPRPADVLADLRLQRELRAAAVARRGGVRQGLADRQDAGRRLAEVRQSARAVTATCGAIPGKKLLFMGGEFGQRREWTHEGELEWWVSELPEHAGVQRWVRDLNRGLPQRAGAASGSIFQPDGFEWLDVDNADISVIAFLRKAPDEQRPCSWSCNFTPVPRSNFLVGVPRRGVWREILNSDAREYGGAGWGNLGGVESVPVSTHGRVESVNLTLPPLVDHHAALGSRMAERRSRAAARSRGSGPCPRRAATGGCARSSTRSRRWSTAAAFRPSASPASRCASRRIASPTVTTSCAWCCAGRRRSSADEPYESRHDGAGQRCLDRRVHAAARRAAIATR